MRDELFEELYRFLPGVAGLNRRKRQQFSDRRILLVYAWAVRNQATVRWACDPAHWPEHLAHIALPSESCMSRRLYQPHLETMLHRIHAVLRPRPDAAMVKTLDAKSLPVGPGSKDRDTGWGPVLGAWIRGYKLFALCDRHGVLEWRVRAMNVAETRVAAELLEVVLSGGGYVLGDALYDTNDLHRQTAALNHQLVAPRQKPRSGLGNCPHHPARLRAIAMLEGPLGPDDPPLSDFGRELYKMRTGIERTFGHMGNCVGGLTAPPAWVRRQRRVELWTAMKIVLNAVRLRRLALEKQAFAA